MIYQMEKFLRRLRRWLSRSEWMIRLLTLPVHMGPATTPGLIMIQIDGLSRRQLERAMRHGEMPFLNKLLHSEHYRLHTLYSGMPTSTPAVQGELFYGVKTAVPAFSFMNRQSGQVECMYEPHSAADMEQQLCKQGEPLLSGGSAYCDIYTGGAEESHFCPSSLGWGSMLRAANPIVLSLFLITHFFSFLRTFVLLIIESGLAIVDLTRGLIQGNDLVKELKFVPTRVAICILLRELVRIGATIDIARGLPIVHLNLLGYDEQAHRRGPASQFAHWTLKGIDKTIERLWRHAHGAARRHYDIWVYSDHGQEETVSYRKAYKKNVEQAITEVYTGMYDKQHVSAHTTQGIATQRAKLLGGNKIQRLFPTQNTHAPLNQNSTPVVAAMGPLGHVYLPTKLSEKETHQFAHNLVRNAMVPLVLVVDNQQQVWACTRDGRWLLPNDRNTIFGPDHPFLDEIAQDLIALCQHPNAGDLVICGWCYGSPSLSFPIENGSHAGIGPEESRSFALLPEDAVLPDPAAGYLRPMHLRHAAQHTLGRKELAKTSSPRVATTRQSIRIMTYNVHSCIGMDGKIAPERIARVIARYQPDVVALQELDAQRLRTDSVDQAHRVAQLLEMDFHFHPAMHIEEERYGDAILTHLPLHVVKSGPLPGLDERPSSEPRGALWVKVEIEGRSLHVFNTHLGLSPQERRAQVNALLGKHWLGHPLCRGETILCGDLNALPNSYVHRRLRQRLKDIEIVLEKKSPQSTFFGRYPIIRIDYVFVSQDIRVLNSMVPGTELTRIASDHLPLIADVRLHNSN
ncbi:MAG: endonuclease/exonuclease/phosphatase family protein [Gammaproteobacteria bacterium]|nr:endonuclease/exonuclease/phosphatase family protein [Gammaproteobacteria bacterium]MDH3465795.1 endonuclease/exonuclease/phosphatase family protein [Gammaproteobacteria bacterium]